MAKYPEVKITYSVVNKAMREGIKEINADAKTLNNTFKLTKEQMKHNSSESEKLEAELSKLNQELELASTKTKVTNSALENTKEITGENSKETRKWSEELTKAQKNEEFLKNKIHETNLKLDEASKKESEAAKASEQRRNSLKGLEQQQESLKTSSERLNKEYELQVAQLGNNAKESDKAKLKQKMLADQLKNSADQVQNLEQQLSVSKSEFGANSAEVKKLENELLDAKVAAQEFANSYADSTNKMKDWGGKLSTYGSQLQSVGKGLTVGVSVPLMAAGGASIKMASDFQSAAAGMRKTNDELIDKNGKVIISYKDLEDGIRNMSKEIPASANEIAGVAEAAGQLGIKTENVLSFSRTMIDMGQATNMSAEDAATSMARLANITGMSQKDFDKLGSTIVDLGNNFATTESEITAMALRLSGAGKQIGMSESDILGFSAALSSVGVEAESGGSSLSKLMIEMQLATEKGIGAFKPLEQLADRAGISLGQLVQSARNGGKELKSVAASVGMTSGELKKLVKESNDSSVSLGQFADVAGLTSEEFAKLFKENPADAIMQFVVGLSKAEEQGTSAIKILDDMEIKEVRLRDALLRSANASGIFKGAIESSNKAWKDNSALTEEVEKRYETFESKLQMLKNQIVDIGIEFGRPLMDALSSVLDALQPVLKTIADLATKFSEASPNTQKFIIALGAIAIALGPIIAAIGTLLTLLGGVMTAIGVGAATAAGIIAAVIGIGVAIAALVAAIVIYWDEIVAATKKLGESIKKVFSEIGVWFKEQGKIISEGWNIFIKGLTDKLSVIGESIKNNFNGIMEWFDNLFTKTGESINGFKEGVVSKFNEILTAIIEWGAQVMENITAFFTRLGEWLMVPISFIQTIFEGLFMFIKAGFEIVIAAIGAAFDWFSQLIEEKVKPPIDALLNFFIEKFQAFQTWLAEIYEMIVTFLMEKGQQIKQVIIDPIVEATLSVVNKIIEMKNKVLQFFEELILGLIEKLIRIKDNMVSKFIEAKDAVFQVVSNIVSGIVTRFDRVVNKVGTIFNNVKDAALGPINAMKDGIKTAIDKIVDIFYNIKLPKFSLKTSSKTFFGKEISYPSGIDVQWNAEGGIFTKPTIVGSHNGIVQGMGEAGAEGFIPLTKKVLGNIGDGIVKSTRSLQQNLDTYVGNYAVRNQISVQVVSNMDGKAVGYGAADYVDDKFESNSQNAMYGIGRRRR